MLTLTTQQIGLLLYLVREMATNYVTGLQQKPELADPVKDRDILAALADIEEALSMSLAPERAADEHLH